MTATTSEPRTGRPTTLAQIVAITNGVKHRTEKTLTAAYHQAQKIAPLQGLSRTYQPRDDEGEQLPPEYGKVQIKVDHLLAEVAEAMQHHLNVHHTLDHTNTSARADIIIDGQVLVSEVPVTYLMWVEKQISSLRTFVLKLPTLDPTRDWTWDEQTETFKTLPVITTRTKKVPRNHVKAPATDKHPAQVDIWHEDVVVGDWTRVDFSGALPASEVNALLARIDKLLDGIRQAREAANNVAVTDQHGGSFIVSYLLGDWQPLPGSTMADLLYGRRRAQP